MSYPANQTRLTNLVAPSSPRDHLGGKENVSFYQQGLHRNVSWLKIHDINVLMGNKKTSWLNATVCVSEVPSQVLHYEDDSNVQFTEPTVSH